jgi:hypothetical protein
MEFNKLVFAGLALGCLAAAGAGGYLARQTSPASRVEPAATAPTTDSSAPAATPDAPRAVAESEGVIAPAPSTPVAAAPRIGAPSEPHNTVAASEPGSRHACSTHGAPRHTITCSSCNAIVERQHVGAAHQR